MSKQRRKKTIKSGSIKNELLKYFLKNPKKRLNAGILLNRMKIKVSKDAVNSALKALHGEDILRQVSEKKYVLNRKHKVAKSGGKGSSNGKAAGKGKQTYQGRVETIKSGAGYIIVDNLESDIYVPARALKGAFNGDEVEVTAIMSKNGRKPEGKVKRIIKRNTPQMMGILEEGGKKYSTLIPASRKIRATVHVGKENYNGAKVGDKVLIDIIHWPATSEQPIWGEVKRVFKGLDDHNWTMESILVENGFNSEHTPASMKEADKFPEKISAEDIAQRRDFRDILTFTIDPDTAQDFDDAISYLELEDGQVEVGVHIADVTHFLKPGTALDKEAYDRSTSVYLVDRCIPMLPERLSNKLCSLMPNVDRLVFSAVFTFNKKNELISEWFGKGIIHSDRRFTYDEGQESLDNKKGLYHKELTAINKIAYKLRKQKFKEGAINFDTEEVKFILDKKNKPTGVFVKQRKDVHLLIEDFMLLANRRVARFITMKDEENPIPFVYRIHDHPDLDRVANLANFMKEFGIEMDFSTPEKVSASFNELSKKARTNDTYKLMMGLAVRTMSKAVYSTNNIGHYGLRFSDYSHFTSPIRRYSDVLTHRILEKNLGGKINKVDKTKLESECMHISKQERKATEAERDSIKYKQVEYISDHIGEEYDGIIAGMIERGVFVELSESKAEGFIPFENFKEHFSVADGRYKATSRNGKKTMKMGDKIRVKVLSTDLLNRQIELQAV